MCDPELAFSAPEKKKNAVQKGKGAPPKPSAKEGSTGKPLRKPTAKGTAKPAKSSPRKTVGSAKAGVQKKEDCDPPQAVLGKTTSAVKAITSEAERIQSIQKQAKLDPIRVDQNYKGLTDFYFENATRCLMHPMEFDKHVQKIVNSEEFSKYEASLREFNGIYRKSKQWEGKSEDALLADPAFQALVRKAKDRGDESSKTKSDVVLGNEELNREYRRLSMKRDELRDQVQNGFDKLYYPLWDKIVKPNINKSVLKNFRMPEAGGGRRVQMNELKIASAMMSTIDGEVESCEYDMPKSELRIGHFSMVGRTIYDRKTYIETLNCRIEELKAKQAATNDKKQIELLERKIDRLDQNLAPFGRPHKRNDNMRGREFEQAISSSSQYSVWDLTAAPTSPGSKLFRKPNPMLKRMLCPQVPANKKEWCEEFEAQKEAAALRNKGSQPAKSSRPCAGPSQIANDVFKDALKYSFFYLDVKPEDVPEWKNARTGKVVPRVYSYVHLPDAGGKPLHPPLTIDDRRLEGKANCITPKLVRTPNYEAVMTTIQEERRKEGSTYKCTP